MKPSAFPAPFTVIGGFLGAGKTTLLNALLGAGMGVRYAVLVNDFGAVNIDASLIAAHEGQTLALNNGCICCSLTNGFIDTMIALMAQRERFDHIVVEASGVSNPERIMDFARIDPELAEDGIVVLVDALRFAEQFADSLLTDTLHAQIVSAHLLVLNKVWASQDQGATARGLLSELAPQTPLLTAAKGDFPISLLFGSGAAAPSPRPSVLPSHHETRFKSLTLCATAPLTPAQFKAFCDQLPKTVLRGKGQLLLSSGVQLWQRVGHTDSLTPLGAQARPFTELVLIGTEVHASIEACWHALIASSGPA